MKDKIAFIGIAILASILFGWIWVNHEQWDKEHEAKRQARIEANLSIFRLTLVPKLGGIPIVTTVKGHQALTRGNCVIVMDGWETMASVCGDVMVEKIK